MNDSEITTGLSAFNANSLEGAIHTLRDMTTVALGIRDITQSENAPFLILPEGYTVHDLEDFMPRPRRAEQKVQIGSLQSLADYINVHGTSYTAVFANPDPAKMGIVAIIDYHNQVYGPDWAAHTATWRCQESENWKTWTGAGINGQWQDQEKFALFLDANIEDVVSIDLEIGGERKSTPSAATLLTIARKLKAIRNAKWEAGEHQENGDGQINWTQETKGKVTGHDDMVIPDYFAVALPVFVGAQPIATRVRFLYQIGEQGKLQLRVDLPARERVRQKAFEDALADLRNRLNNPDIQVFMGSPG